ncbi:MAG: SDR family NAD(P)-dependent oxidoreductase [Proteobacteria bacterium]|nr:SDR family NAD(P)-dependent oxidoreductase [Pseudomonadota bacterium]
MPRSCIGRVAIVTGASRGIGQAIACRLAAEGARVALLGRPADTRDTRLAGSLEQTVEMLRAVSEAPPLVVTTDIADPSLDKAGIVRRVAGEFEAAPDVLVNVAAAPREFGGGKPPIPFAETPREWFQRSVDVNVWAAWDLAKQVVPGMRERGAGWILTISSIQAEPRPVPPARGGAGALGGACLYGGTKAFLDRIATGAAQELYADNIAVNNLSPTGPVRTPLSSTVVGDLPDDAWEPMETMVEAALALCTGDPRKLTSRIAYSLPLLAELERPVYSLDGGSLFEGWQPDADDPRKRMTGYLAGH